MSNFQDILPGQYIWFSKEGNIGQYRVVDIDKENNKLTYTDRQNHNFEIPFNYDLARNNDFFADAQDAVEDAKRYAMTYFDIKNPGTPNAHVVYKSPEKISIDNVKQMLFD